MSPAHARNTTCDEGTHTGGNGKPASIDLSVRDPAQSATFYCSVFGLKCDVVNINGERVWHCTPKQRPDMCPETRPDTPSDTTESITSMSFRFRQSHGQSHGYSQGKSRGQSDGFNRNGAQGQRIRIGLSSSTHVNQAYVRAARRGYRTGMPTLSSGRWQITLFDPNGNEVQIYATP